MTECPKCKYDMFDIYYGVVENDKKSRYCKIIKEYPGGGIEGGCDWDIEFMCPKCKTKWITTDGSY